MQRNRNVLRMCVRLALIGVVVALTACQRTLDDVELKTPQSQQKHETYTLVGEARLDDMRLHTGRDHTGHIAFMVDDDLYWAGFDGQPARGIAENIEALTAAPAGEAVIYLDPAAQVVYELQATRARSHHC